MPLRFRSLIHLELIIVQGIWYLWWFSFIFLCGLQLSPPYLDWYVMASTCHRVNFHVCLGLFLSSPLCFIGYLPTLSDFCSQVPCNAERWGWELVELKMHVINSPFIRIWFTGGGSRETSLVCAGEIMSKYISCFTITTTWKRLAA